MSVIGATLQANAAFAEHHNPADGNPPTPKLVIVTCMDPRATNIGQILGLVPGDAGIIRNAGSVINEDSILSLFVSTRILGAQEVMIVNHTDWGMTTFHDDDPMARLEVETGSVSVAPARFYSFSDAEENARRQVHRVKTHPWISRDIPVRGFVYDVHTGKMREVMDGPATVEGKIAEMR
jgi:carbonic anhydrase